MNERRQALLRKELRQITRSRRTTLAAAAVPALMLLFVAFGDIITAKVGFGSRPIYILSAAHAVSGTFLVRHYSLPVLVTISAMVTPSIVMGDILLGERERRTLDLLVALPVAALDVVLAKLAAVLVFALSVTVPLFAANVLLVSAFGYASLAQTVALSALLLSAVAYSAASALLIALLAGEPRAANIVSGLILGPVVPFEGVVLSAVHDVSAIGICAVSLALCTGLALLWSIRLLSFQRLAGAI
jgi:ABC-type transport system involved in multi-copper enzyme maturation permease subunit